MAGPDGVVIAVGVIISLLIIFGIVVFMVYVLTLPHSQLHLIPPAATCSTQKTRWLPGSQRPSYS
jgi:hypothetical protein